MYSDILTAIPLGVLLSFLIGPVFFVLLETSATKGFRAALMFNLGVILADVLFISIAYFTSYRILESIKDEPFLFVVGGVVMIVYGLVSFVKIRRLQSKQDTLRAIEKRNYLGLLGKGFLLNFINIGVLGFWLMILITIAPSLDMNAYRIVVFFASILITYFVIDIFKILLAKQLRNKLSFANIAKVKKLTSILLIVFGVLIILQGWFPSEQKIVKKALEKIETPIKKD
ncbi:MAG: LysE family transporter [Bacteroidota bacterium]|nr:LysE family transporter [Bacteroidota bacterium]